MRNLWYRRSRLELTLVAAAIAGLALLASCTQTGMATLATSTPSGTADPGRGPGMGPPAGATPGQGPGGPATMSPGTGSQTTARTRSQAPPSELAMGGALYLFGCGCHVEGSEGAPPESALSKLSTSQIQQVVRQGRDGMPQYDQARLSDEWLEDLAAYLTEARHVAMGNPLEGAAAIQQYNCGSCHTIPGIPGANGTVGPSLAGFANSSQIAGTVDNTPDNLIKFIMDPKQVDPNATMPNLGVNQQDATNIAGYLYTLVGQGG